MSSSKSKASTPAIAEQKGKGKGGVSSTTSAKPTAKVADAKGAEEHDASDISFGGDDAPTEPTSPTAPAVSIESPAPTINAPSTAPAAAAVDAPQTVTENPLDIAFATLMDKARELDKLDGKLPDAATAILQGYYELTHSAVIDPESLASAGITLNTITAATTTLEKIIAQISSLKGSSSGLQALLARSHQRSATSPLSGAGGGAPTPDDDMTLVSELGDESLGVQPGTIPTSTQPIKFQFPSLEHYDKKLRDSTSGADTSATATLVNLVKNYIIALIATNLKASEPILAQIYQEALGTFKLALEAAGCISIEQARVSTQAFALGSSRDEEAAPPSGKSVTASRGEAMLPDKLKALEAAARDSVYAATGTDLPQSFMRLLSDGSTQRVFKILSTLLLAALIRRVVQIRIANAVILALAKVTIPKHLKHEIDVAVSALTKILANTAHVSVENDQVTTCFSWLFSNLTSHVNTGGNALSSLRRILRPRMQTAILFRAIATVGKYYILRPGEHIATQLGLMDKQRLENIDGWKPDSHITWGDFGFPLNSTTEHFELLGEGLLVFIVVEQISELLKQPAFRGALDYFTDEVFVAAQTGTLTVEALQDILTAVNEAGIDFTIPKAYKPVEPLQLVPSTSSQREQAEEPSTSGSATVDQHGAFGAVSFNKGNTDKDRSRQRERGGGARDRQRSSSRGRGEPSLNIYASARALAGPNFENLAALVINLNAHIKEVHGIDYYFALRDPRNPSLGPKTPPESDWASILQGDKQLRKDFYLLYMFLQDTCKSQDVKLSAIGKAYRDEKDSSWAGLTKATVSSLFAKRPNKSAAPSFQPRTITIYDRSFGEGDHKTITIKEFSS